MKRIDSYFTPPTIVGRMLGAVAERSHDCVADFAVGDGALLAAAAAAWPTSVITATDIRSRRIEVLKRLHPGWKLDRCDFLSVRSRGRSQLLNELAGKVSLVLLNPPFSFRGGTRTKLNVFGAAVDCSPAFGFLLAAVAYLAPRGEFVAILPASSMSSDRDQAARRVLTAISNWKIVARYGRDTFARCAARTVLIQGRLDSLTIPERTDRTARRLTEAGTPVTMLRGTLQMHRVRTAARDAALPLVHTTELRLGFVDWKARRAPRNAKSITGPAVLIPRVGNPTTSHIALCPDERRFAMSDCVIALTCNSVSTARRLHRALVAHWNVVEACYDGTCASYTTLDRVAAALRTLGFVATHRPIA